MFTVGGLGTLRHMGQDRFKRFCKSLSSSLLNAYCDFRYKKLTTLTKHQTGVVLFVKVHSFN